MVLVWDKVPLFFASRDNPVISVSLVLIMFTF